MPLRAQPGCALDGFFYRSLLEETMNTSRRFMHTVHDMVRAGLFAALACAASGSMAQQAQAGNDAAVEPAVARQQAQEIAQGDPQRWYRDDDGQQTLRKEIGAALDEAQSACRKRPAAERDACLREARAVWQRDMDGLQKQLQNQPQAQVRTHRVE